MIRRALVFEAPYLVSVLHEPAPEPRPDQVLVRTLASAISSGTELLFYRGLVPAEMEVDATIPALAGRMSYPLRYGYAAVGRVIRAGADAGGAWEGRMFFSFQPHQSHFAARPSELIPVPEWLEPGVAALLPSMETAVNFVLDGQPAIGENTVVLGQGVVGLLTAALLARMPLRRLVTLDRFELRRRASKQLGASEAIDAEADGAQAAVEALLQEDGGADLVYELTGDPSALNLAIALAGYAGRIIAGSWYGRKRAEIDLGGRFHRNRIRLMSSQVSTIAPERTGRWDQQRRLRVAWEQFRVVPAAGLITHRFPIERAAEAYALLDRHPDQAMQVLITYD